MYRQHATKIQAYAQQSADNLEHVGQFVAFTIHAPFDDAISRLQSYRDGRYQELDEVIQATHQAIAWLTTHKSDLHWHLQDIYYSPYSDAEKADYMLSYVAAEVPGLGLVKAGFLIQLTYGLSACLDTHNMQRFNIKPKSFDHFKRLKTAKTRHRKVKAYHNLCNRSGGTEKIWDTWCAYVADKYLKYKTADEVSQLHCSALNLV